MKSSVPTDRITREETIFNAAVELRDPDKRATYLDLACEGDPVLRARLEKMLAADTDSFFEKPVPAPSPTIATTLVAESASPIAHPGAMSERASHASRRRHLCHSRLARWQHSGLWWKGWHGEIARSEHATTKTRAQGPHGCGQVIGVFQGRKASRIGRRRQDCQALAGRVRRRSGKSKRLFDPTAVTFAVVRREATERGSATRSSFVRNSGTGLFNAFLQGCALGLRRN
jgi:hypothetical protein